MTTSKRAPQRKLCLFLLAALCAWPAGAGLQLLLHGADARDVITGGGRLLLWGSVTALLLARVHGRRLPGISLAFWCGAGLLLAALI